MQGCAPRVIYGVLKCTESQRLKPSQTHSHDSALPRRFNKAKRSHTPALAIALCFLISISAMLDLFVSDFQESSQDCSEVIQN